ncbi:hypothetical protein CYY_006150 [Polysphondylium violaceum]|uniref:FNIP repeat-containing protein n=1 Tax=Polysphondylium violaceum TaxID=133409 RepID=A0A8J4PRT5_9MYCE|nr:hypothetical protein CYY_006150 [Polysphondylium violaceum]
MNKDSSISNNNNKYSDLFYLIWRNSYLNKLIKGKVLQNVVIKIEDLSDIKENNKHLAIFSSRDVGLENNIFIKLFIDNIETFDQFQQSGHRHVVNYLFLQHYKGLSMVVPEGIRRMGFYDVVEEKFNCQLPLSLTHLDLACINSGRKNIFIINILQHLPPNLVYLSLPHHLSTITQIQSIQLPDTLEDLDYTDKYRNLSKFRVPNNNKIFKSCTFAARSIEDLHWLKDQKWIGGVNIGGIENALYEKLVPSHITTIGFNFFEIYQEHPLKKDQLPSRLECLAMHSYNIPLEMDIFPSTLTTLYFEGETDIDANVLPNTLKTLEIRGVTDNYCYVPPSVTNLKGIYYLGTFKSNSPLCCLTELSVHSLDPSVTMLLAHTTTLSLTFRQLAKGTTLANTPIEKLSLKAYLNTRIPLESGFLPLSLRRLITIRIDINSADIIPNSCVYLETDIKDLDKSNLIPQSVKVNKFKRESYW